MRRFIKLIAVGIISGLCAFAASAEAACKLVVGVVPQFEARRIHAVWTPILQELSDKTGCSYVLEGSKNIPEFEQKFKAGKFDLAYMNPYHSVMAFDAQGYVPITRSGDKKLQGILTVRTDSPIQSVADLEGATIAFPSPNALGASLLMRAELATKHGLSFTPKYVSTHSSVYLHVFKELTVAGGGVGRTLREQPDALKQGLRVIYKTEQVFAHPLVVHPRVAPELQASVQAAFLQMAAENPDLVDGIPMRGPVAAALSDYQILRDMNLARFAAP